MKVTITPNCRIVQGGDKEAFDKAIELIRERYDVWIKMPLYDRKNFTITLGVETPKSK